MKTRAVAAFLAAYMLALVVAGLWGLRIAVIAGGIVGFVLILVDGLEDRDVRITTLEAEKRGRL